MIAKRKTFEEAHEVLRFRSSREMSFVNAEEMQRYRRGKRMTYRDVTSFSDDNDWIAADVRYPSRKLVEIFLKGRRYSRLMPAGVRALK